MFSKIKSYFTESYQELKKVNWPTRSETINLTLVVIGFSLAIAIFLGVLDMVFSFGLTNFIL